MPNSPPPVQYKLSCSLCNVQTNDAFKALEKHFAGKKHRKRMDSSTQASGNIMSPLRRATASPSLNKDYAVKMANLDVLQSPQKLSYTTKTNVDRCVSDPALETDKLPARVTSTNCRLSVPKCLTCNVKLPSKDASISHFKLVKLTKQR